MLFADSDNTQNIKQVSSATHGARRRLTLVIRVSPKGQIDESLLIISEPECYRKPADSSGEVSTGSGSDRVMGLATRPCRELGPGRIHHPTRAARAGTPARSRY